VPVGKQDTLARKKKIIVSRLDTKQLKIGVFCVCRRGGSCPVQRGAAALGQRVRAVAGRDAHGGKTAGRHSAGVPPQGEFYLSVSKCIF